MSASTAGALKAFVEQQHLRLSVYRDRARADTPLPYATVRERISLVPERSGDFGDGRPAVREQVQLDVWQAWRAVDGSLAESYTLVDDLVALLHGAQLRTAPKRTYAVSVDSAVRVPELDNPGTGETLGRDRADQGNVIRDVLTLTIRRDS